MTITTRDRKRLAALIAISANSFGARLEALTGEQRGAYEHYRNRMSAWVEKLKAHCPDDDDPDACLYERTLETRTDEPKLRRDVERALFGGAPKILLTDTEETAVRKWVECTR